MTANDYDVLQNLLKDILKKIIDKNSNLECREKMWNLIGKFNYKQYYIVFH